MLLWALLEPQKLSPALRNALEDSDNTLVVSAASAWEIATKWRFGKLQHARAVVENYAMALHRLGRLNCRSAVPWPSNRSAAAPGNRQVAARRSTARAPTSISPRPRKKPRGSSVPPRWAWGWGPSKPLAARMQ